MTDFVDYDQVLDDAVAMLQANTTGFKLVSKNIEDIQFGANNMPLCDVRLGRVVPDLTGQQTYYVALILDLELVAFDLSSKAAAFTIVADLLNQVQQAFRTHPRYGANWDATIIGPVELITAQEKSTGAFAQGALAQVTIFAYTQ